MSRKISFAPGEFYHLYNRGTEKRIIFESTRDYERFLALLYLCNSPRNIHVLDLLPRGSTSWDLKELLKKKRGGLLIDLCAYCLMPNHFHLLVRERVDGGISRFMQKMSTGYTMYFNTRHDRTGALFQGRFKATHAGNDEYLKYLISYIHLNPIKLIESLWKEQGIKNRAYAEKYLTRYRWSSFLDYCAEERPEVCLLEKRALPGYFETPSTFKESVTEWLSHKDTFDSHEVQPRGNWEIR